MATSSVSKKAELFDWNKDCCISNISALWEDNRESVLEILRQNPAVTLLDSKNKDNPVIITWKQRLVFAEESLSHLILRNVLRDPTADGISAVAAAMKRKQQQQQQQPPYPSNLGIVGTHILNASSTEATTRAAEETSSLLSFDVSPAGAVELLRRNNNNPFEDNTNINNNQQQQADEQGASHVYTYFLRPTASHTRLVAQSIRQSLLLLPNNNEHNSMPPACSSVYYRIVYIPHCTAMCERLLCNMLPPHCDRVSIRELHLDLIPLEKDVLSMEIPYLLQECDIHGMPSSSVTAMARSILKLQDLLGGVIPRISGIGPLAEAVIDKTFALRLQEHLEELATTTTTQDEILLQDTTAAASSTDIDALLILDRKVDLVTPMLTPLTYEGLIDDIVGIDTGYVQVDESLVDPDSSEATKNKNNTSSTNPFDNNLHLEDTATTKSKKVSLALNGTDPLFAEVRSQHVEKFGSFLQDQAKALRESHSHFTNKDKDLTEIHQFVKQIPLLQQNLRSLTLQIHLAEMVKRTTDDTAFQERWHTERSMLEGDFCYEVLEDLVCNSNNTNSDEEDPKSLCLRFLRLLCLQSVTSGGIKPAKFDSLRREVIHSYGYETMFLLNNLEKVGALRKRETSYFDASSSSFSALRKLLNLINNADVNNLDPDDISYVSSGYAPLSVRLIEAAAAGWAGGISKEEVLKELPGAKFLNLVQRNPPEEFTQALKKPPKSKGLEDVEKNNTKRKKPVLMVFYVGGVTFMEIAALRLLSKKPSFPFQIICCTTKVVNGNTFISTLS